MERLNVCLLGCGTVAARHARAAQRLRHPVNLTFASRSREKALRYNARFGGGGAFGSYEEACAAWEVSAVVICTPPSSHVAAVELAASGGKAILLEKPAARTPAELAQLETAVRTHGVTCMVAENYFFKPALRRLREWLAADMIGAPLVIALTRAGRQRSTGWRSDPDEMGGGALLEGGVHWIDFLCELGGDVRDVLAVRPRPGRSLTAPMEDTLQLVVRFASGAVGTLLHSWNLPNRLRGLGLSKIYGADGTIVFESNGLAMWLAGRRTRGWLPGGLDMGGSLAMLEHFFASVRDGRAPAMSLALARRDLEVVWAAYRALATGRFEIPGSRT